jgi:tRNA-dihydrouridine synthase B
MKCGGGSDMMKNREKTLTIIQHLSEQLEQLPFSIKVRTGLNEADKPQQADFLVKASQRCSTISIHGRTLKQLYSGDADWEFIAQVQQRIKAVSPHCQIIGNGGITSYEQAKTLQKHYELNGIMIGQAAIGNPRIFTPYQPTLSDKLETILRHLDISVACDQLFEALFLNGRREICLKTAQLEEQIQSNLKKADFEAHSTVEFRKFLFQYLKGIPGSREWKSGMLSIKKYRELRNQIIDFFENKG